MNYIMEIENWYYIEPTLKASLDFKKMCYVALCQVASGMTDYVLTIL